MGGVASIVSHIYEKVIMTLTGIGIAVALLLWLGVDNIVTCVVHSMIIACALTWCIDGYYKKQRQTNKNKKKLIY